LVPASGFYEWKRDGGSKQPFWIHPAEGGLLSFAGIWERWSRPGAEPRHTVAILTTAATAGVAAIHHRMPVTIGVSDYRALLDRATAGDDALAILRRRPAPTLATHPVSTRVNRPQEDDAHLIDPIGS
jgi:putative SOS response-associated peptidase YedK